MIEKWFEDFMLLERQSSSDDLGGELVFFAPLTVFRGVLTYTAGEAMTAVGQFALSEHPVLLHEFDVTLAPDDHVRRESTGAIYRVTGQSDDMRTPAHAGLQFAQVPVERLVSVC